MSGGLRTFDHAAGLGASIQGGAAAGWGQPQMSAAHMLLQQQQQIQQQQQAGIMGLGQWGAGVHDMQAAAAVAAAAAAAAVAAGGSGLGALGGPGFPGQYFMPPRPQVTDPLALSLAAGDSGSTLGHDQMSKGSSSSSAIVAPPATAVVIESSATTTRGRSPSPAKPRSKSPAKVAAMAQKVEEEEVPAAKVDVAATKVRTARTPSPKREAVPAAAVVAAASPAKAPSSAPSTPRKSGKAAKAERKRADAAAAAVTPARAKSPEVQKVTEARPVSPKKQQPEVFAEELPSEDDFAVAEPMPSISAWGLAEDAAAADMWESTFLPTTAGSSSSGRGQSSPSVTASPAQASRTVPASSLSSAAAAAEAPWVKATKPATPKMSMSEIMKLEATKKKAQRANAAASAGAAAATATVIPDISAAWKPAAAGTKSFAEIQAEEAVREAARQRKRQAEAEKLASSIAEVEAMLPLAGKKGWGEVPLVQPVAIADETAALKAAKTKEAQQQQQRAAAATPTMGGFAAAAKKAAGAGSVPAVSGGDSWVVIGAGAKPVKPATPTPTAAAAGTASPKIPAAATAVPRVQAVAPTALMPKVSAAHSRRGINEETAKWATAALKRVPQAAEMVPNLLSMFAEFAIADDSASGTVDSVADIVLQMSTSIDSRAFAAEFVRRRRVDLGMPGTWAVSKSSGSGKQGGGSSSSDTGFVAVGKGKKKGGRK
ncbi:hypothetical protein BC828DRAFT_376452 [Blastocladiella britannica]|nr:hypothetical protein BC828DRAFT_376452 [Blastocladiella britannica]